MYAVKKCLIMSGQCESSESLESLAVDSTYMYSQLPKVELLFTHPLKNDVNT